MKIHPEYFLDDTNKDILEINPHNNGSILIFYQKQLIFNCGDSMIKRNKYIFFIIIYLFCFRTGVKAQSHQPSITEIISLTLKKSSITDRNMHSLKQIMQPSAFKKLESILSKGNILFMHPSYPLMEIKLPDGNFEIINILVRIPEKPDIIIDHKHLILVCDSGLVKDLYFEDEIYHYHDYIEFKRKVDSKPIIAEIRNRITEMENSTLHQNITDLEKIYDDHAKIITGRMNQDGNLDYYKMGKKQYLQKLDTIFHKAPMKNFRLQIIQLYPHPIYQYVYGIRCFQNWESSSYSDQGTLFLIYNMRTKKIIFRMWTPK